MSEERQGLEYWIQWQVFVCGLIIVAPAIAAAILISRWKDEKLRSSDLWTPCWRNLHPIWLLAYRAAVVLIMSALLFWMVFLDGVFAFYYFYTQWTFTLVIIYFAVLWKMSRRMDFLEEKSKKTTMLLQLLEQTVCKK